MQFMRILAMLLAFEANAEVRIYGDSIFTTRNNGVQRYLPVRSRQFAEQGAWSDKILNQYMRKRAREGDTVIFDSGGNDMIGSGCKGELTERCRQIAEGIIGRITEMLIAMQEDRVAKVIILGPHYPHGWQAGFEEIIDWTYPKLRNACARNIACTAIVDPRRDLPAMYLEWDGVHPNEEGVRVIAGLLAKKL